MISHPFSCKSLALFAAVFCADLKEAMKKKGRDAKQ